MRIPKKMTEKSRRTERRSQRRIARGVLLNKPAHGSDKKLRRLKGNLPKKRGRSLKRWLRRRRKCLMCRNPEAAEGDRGTRLLLIMLVMWKGVATKAEKRRKKMASMEAKVKVRATKPTMPLAVLADCAERLNGAWLHLGNHHPRMKGATMGLISNRP